MPTPSEANRTGVESYDHGNVVQLPEYHGAREALDALVHAINERGLGIDQTHFLVMAEQMAASLSYSDSSGHPNNNCPGAAHGAWPYRVNLEGGWVYGTYRCPHCGIEWETGYDVNVSAFI